MFNLLRTTLAIFTRGLPVRPFLACAAIRMFLYTFTPRQIQLFIPPTIDTYRRFIRSARARARKAGDEDLMEQLREDIEVLPDGASHILWIGDRHTATRFVYFFHGGGYMTPAIPGHFEWCLQAYVLAPRLEKAGGKKDHAAAAAAGNDHAQDGRHQRERVAVAFLQYTLTPSAKFPTQMSQAAAGLNHLLLRKGIPPSQLVMGGDSAGASIAVQLLSHVLHPYPTAAEGISLVEPLAGLFLVSPLVHGDLTTPSFTDGLPCDMLSVGIFDAPNREMFHVPKTGVMGWLFPNRRLVESKAFREGKKWALLAGVDEKWLDGVGKVVGKVYVTCGKHEILRDQGIFIAETLRKSNSDVDVKLEVAEKEAHDFILLEGERREVGDATVRMRTWFSYVWA